MIRLNYLQSETDVQTLVVGLKLLRQIFETHAFDEFQGEELAPGSDMQSDEAIAAYIRDACDSVWHPVGTCKMGSDPMAVVDPELRVHGIEGLRIVDASIMPTITTGNTNAPTITIGEKPTICKRSYVDQLPDTHAHQPGGWTRSVSCCS